MKRCPPLVGRQAEAEPVWSVLFLTSFCEGCFHRLQMRAQLHWKARPVHSHLQRPCVVGGCPAPEGPDVHDRRLSQHPIHQRFANPSITLKHSGVWRAYCDSTGCELHCAQASYIKSHLHARLRRKVVATSLEPPCFSGMGAFCSAGYVHAKATAHTIHTH